MTENENTGKRPRIAGRAAEGREEFQQHKSFAFSHRDGDEEREGEHSGFGGDRERRSSRFGSDRDRKFGDKPRGERRFSDDRRRFDDKDRGDRKFGDRPRGERSFGDDRRRFNDGERGDRKFGDRPRGERSFGDDRRRFNDGERGDRKFGDRPRGERSFSDDRRRFNDGERGDRKFGDRPRGERSFGDDRRRFNDGERGDRKFGDRPRGERSFGDDRRRFNDGERGDRKFGDRPRGERSFGDDRRRFNDGERGDRKFGDRPRGERSFGDDRRRFNDGERGDRKFGDRPRGERSFGDDRRRFNDGERGDRKFGDRPRGDRNFGDDRRRNFTNRDDNGPRSRSFAHDTSSEMPEEQRRGRRGYQREKDPLYDRPKADGLIRLNKYLADSGICSRREADDLIKAGCVTVNGEVVTEMGIKVKPEDKVVYGGQTLSREKLRYILLNKPKGYITTSDDPYERETVMELVKDACEERIFPVGRLDKLTTGLLLFTNDGEMAKNLTHPSHEVTKLYQVTLDKPLTKNDMLRIAEGVELDDGPIQVDAIAYVEGDESKKEIGVELHSGRNRIVRRIFEHFGYEVEKLDRVMFAGLDKYQLPRGNWRFLTDLEIQSLKKIK